MGSSLAFFVLSMAFILLYLSKDANAFSEELIQLAADGQFPFIVSIMYRHQHICGGSLIARKAVVTNAKCCQQIEVKENARVSAGSLKPFSEEAHVRDVVQHNSSYNHDICILILEEQLPQNQVISTVKTSSLYTLQHTDCTVIGWNANVQLAFENVTAKPCDNASKMLCASSQHQGDDGSFIYCDGRLEGLLVKKPAFGAPSSFFIRLGLFKSWIEQSIRDSQVDFNSNRNHVTAFIISTLIPLTLGLLLH